MDEAERIKEIQVRFPGYQTEDYVKWLEIELAQAEAGRDELIMAVSSKHNGETRFETALRYIREREQQTLGPFESQPERED